MSCSLENLQIEEEPLFSRRGIQVAPGGGEFEFVQIPVLKGTVDRLPEGLEALIITADLQCQDAEIREQGEDVLMGETMADDLALRAEAGLLPPLEKTGVLLAGDFYSELERRKRGATGDVENVWWAFSERFAFVAGVAGNHDLFRGEDAFDTIFTKVPFDAVLPDEVNISPLHGNSREIYGLHVGGISGIIGNKKRPWRNSVDELEEMSHRLGAGNPMDVLLLHQGPSLPEANLRGSDLVRNAMEGMKSPPGLIICGHCHWPVPLAVMEGSGIRVLNVDSRVIVITAR